MARTARRLGAAFFVSVAIILALALSVLYLMLPVKVEAQFIYEAQQMQCADGEMREADGRTSFELDPDQTAAYVAAASTALGQIKWIDEGISSRLILGADGWAVLVYRFEGQICNHGRIGPRAHRAGFRAVFGEPS